MNRGAISVIYLALSAVCLIGLYGVYKPQINADAGNTFGKVEHFVDTGFRTPPKPFKVPFVDSSTGKPTGNYAWSNQGSIASQAKKFDYTLSNNVNGSASVQKGQSSIPVTMPLKHTQFSDLFGIKGYMENDAFNMITTMLFIIPL